MIPVRFRTKLAIAALFTLSARQAYGDAPVDTPSPSHMPTPRIACREAELADCVRLRPGYWVDEAWWTKHDEELKSAQDARTQLTAENKSLRTTASGWQPGWKTLALTLAVGISLGIYVETKL